MWGRAITAMGSTVAQLMQPARAAPGAPFVCLPLCCSPNAYCSNRSGGLTRWSHVNLTAGYTTVKF
jgi:hypothetical protein